MKICYGNPGSYSLSFSQNRDFLYSLWHAKAHVRSKHTEKVQVAPRSVGWRAKLEYSEKMMKTNETRRHFVVHSSQRPFVRTQGSLSHTHEPATHTAQCRTHTRTHKSVVTRTISRNRKSQEFHISEAAPSDNFRFRSRDGILPLRYKQCCLPRRASLRRIWTALIYNIEVC